MADFSIQQKNRADTTGIKSVVVNGEMTVQHAGEIRDVLMEGFSDGAGLCLELGNVSEIDIAGLQLLCAAHKTAMTNNKYFSVGGIDCAAIRSVIRDAGFPRHTGCAQDIDKTCIWTEGEK